MSLRIRLRGLLIGIAGCGGGAAVSGAEQTEGPADAGSAGSGPGDEVGSDAPGSSGSTGSVDTTTDASESSDGSVGTSSGEASTTGPAPCDAGVHCTEPTEDGACRHELVLPDGMRLAVWSNLALDGDGGCRTAIDRAVVVVHGNDRNPWDYMAAMLEAAELAGVASHTLVVAPWFPAPEDDVPDGWHTWDPGGSGWKSGDDSLSDPALSSFAAIDHLVVDRVLEPTAFPMLAEIVVTGHSAGGQFVQRWAVATDVDAPMRFVVANPSSYLYLDAWRWDGAGMPPAVDFALPSDPDCDDYDDYKYGIQNIPDGHYVAEHMAGIPDQYLARDVIYLLGDADVTDAGGLDTTCPAMLQGANRRERGLVFAAYLDERHAGQSHAHALVPGVDHDHEAMFTSAEGLAALFGE